MDMDRDDPSGRCAGLSEELIEEELELDESDSRTRERVRARTISIKRLSKRELEKGRLAFPPGEGPARPTKRAECQQGEHEARPCPFVSCKYHLYLDTSERTGAIKINFPDLEVWEMSESCTLDIAARGGATLEEVGVILNLTRERIRQMEVKGLAKLKALNEMAALQDYVDGDHPAEHTARVAFDGDKSTTFRAVTAGRATGSHRFGVGT